MAGQLCETCGASMPLGALFCTQCGTRFAQSISGTASGPEAERPSPPSPPQTDPTLIVTPQADPTQVWQSAPAVPVAEPPQAPSMPPAAPSWQTPPPTSHAPPAMPPTGYAPPPSTPTFPPAPPTFPPSPQAPPWQATPPGAPQGPPWQASPPTSPQTPLWQSPPPAPPQMPPFQGTAAGSPPQTPVPFAGALRARRGGRVAAVISALGGLAIVAGAFLSWLKIVPVGGTAQTITGWTLSNDAKTVAVLGALAVVLSVVVIGGQLRGAVRALLVVVGAVVLAIAAYDTYDILHRIANHPLTSHLPAGTKITAPGVGLIVVLVGGVLLLVGALAMRPQPESVKKEEQVSVLT